MFCGRSSMVEHQLPKLNTRVRFPSPAPAANCRSQVANLTLWGSRFFLPAFACEMKFRGFGKHRRGCSGTLTIFREPSGKIPQSEARCFVPLILKRATNGLCWWPFFHTFLSRIAMYSFPGRGTRKLPEKIPRSVTVISQVSMTSTRQETPSSLRKLRKLGRPKP